MDMLPAEIKTMYLITPISLFVGLDAQNPVLIAWGAFYVAWIISRWIGPWRVIHVKTTVCND